MDKCLLTKEDIDAHEGTAKIHFLNSNAKRINKSLGEETIAVKAGDYVNLNKRMYRNKGMAWNLVDIQQIEEPQAGKK